MAERTFEWWKTKRGFRGDEEFLHLAQLAPDRRTYLAAVGLLFSVYDAAHTQDARVPRGTIVAPDGDLLELLEAADLLEGGGVPSRTWNKYRVGDRARDASGRFLPPASTKRGTTMVPSVDHAGTKTETETERENETIVTKRYEQGTVHGANHARPPARGVEKLGSTPAFKNLERHLGEPER